MSTGSGVRRRPGGRGAGLSRAQIIEAAIALLDAEGLGALTVRRLARQLDVEPPALYWHFANKDEICRAVVAEISAQLRVDSTGAGTPREALEQHLGAIREHWLRHPSALELGRRFPPTVDSEVARTGIGHLLALGIQADAAVDHYRALTWSAMGFVFVEQALAGSVHHQRADSNDTRWILEVAGSGAAPSEFDTDVLFRSTIGLLLDGLLIGIESGSRNTST